jgi:hypothetical protein
MKIISKFRDYYDGYADYSSDDQKVRYYIREEQDINISKYLLQNFEDELLRTPHDFEAGYLIIAGKVHPFVSVYTRGDWDYSNGSGVYISSHVDFYYDNKTLMERYEKEREKLNKAIKKRDYPMWKWYGGNLSNRNVNNFFNRKYPDMTNLCIEHDTPIILICPESHRYKEKDKTYRICTKNVNLKEHGLSKVFTAPEIYQILDVFVSNVLVKDEMPMSPMTDEEKIQSHGFDKKSSFRHPIK